MYSTQSTSSNLQLPRLSLMKCLKVLQTISHQWMEIGIRLRIEIGRLHQIEKEGNGDCQLCLRYMLRVWLSRDDPPSSWAQLADALDNMHGNEHIASLIRDEYITI